jgi:hypothetical protein
LPIVLGSNQSPTQSVTGVRATEMSSGMKLATLLYLVPKLRMCGVMSPLPHYFVT